MDLVLGIDVSKARLDAALWIPSTRKWYAIKVDNDAVAAVRLLAWARSKSKLSGPIRCVLEATGPYHEEAALALFESGAEVVVANPLRVRDFAKGLAMLNKTDTLDARVLARYGEQRDAAFEPWIPPAVEIRVLRALLGRLQALEEDLQRERNRLEASQAGQGPAVVIDSLRRSIEHLQQERERLRRQIDDHFDQHPGLKADRDRLQSIPGIGPATSAQMVCLLRRRSFRDARQAAAFVGLVPRHHESGSSVRKASRIGHGEPKLRAALYMAAIVASRHNPALQAIYQQMLARNKAKMAAIGALMRRLVHISFGLLKHQTHFNPSLAYRTT